MFLCAHLQFSVTISYSRVPFTNVLWHEHSIHRYYDTTVDGKSDWVFNQWRWRKLDCLHWQFHRFVHEHFEWCPSNKIWTRDDTTIDLRTIYHWLDNCILFNECLDYLFVETFCGCKPRYVDNIYLCHWNHHQRYKSCF